MSKSGYDVADHALSAFPNGEVGWKPAGLIGWVSAGRR
jgi:hypothetical protein